VIGSRRLTDLIAEYEGTRGFDVPGGYGGIVPAYFRYGPLLVYFGPFSFDRAEYEAAVRAVVRTLAAAEGRGRW
jgi:hypothetical protein